MITALKSFNKSQLVRASKEADELNFSAIFEDVEDTMNGTEPDSRTLAYEFLMLGLIVGRFNTFEEIRTYVKKT